MDKGRTMALFAGAMSDAQQVVIDRFHDEIEAAERRGEAHAFRKNVFILTRPDRLHEIVAVYADEGLAQAHVDADPSLTMHEESVATSLPSDVAEWHSRRNAANGSSVDPRLVEALAKRGYASGDWYTMVHDNHPDVIVIEHELGTQFDDEGNEIANDEG